MPFIITDKMCICVSNYLTRKCNLYTSKIKKNVTLQWQTGQNQVKPDNIDIVKTSLPISHVIDYGDNLGNTLQAKRDTYTKGTYYWRPMNTRC